MPPIRSFQLLRLLDRLTRRKKQLIAVAADMLALPFALWCALALRLGDWTPPVLVFWPAFVVSVLVAVPVFVRIGLYRQVIRYIGNDVVFVVARGVTITALAIAAIAYMIPLAGFPRSVPVIFWALAFLYVAGTRFAVRNMLHQRLRAGSAKLPILIYGAGNNGADLSRMLRLKGHYDPRGFVDDDPQVQGSLIDGLGVYPPEQLARLLDTTGAKEVLVAVPADALEDRRRIFEILEPHSVHVRLIPDIAELLSGRQGLTSIRDVKVEDLLGRSAVDPFPDLLSGQVRGHAVMVTGAAGSIGSELCRRIMRQQPRALLLLDHNEYGLYEIFRELQQQMVEHQQRGDQEPVVLVPLLGSVLDHGLIVKALQAYQVETLYHAAAYKHVTMVESNVIQGIRNNTFGTLYLAEAAVEAGVRHFILISTDKAVRTTNVMGATKRMAELVLQGMQEVTPETTFSMVRFGNVLGSSGSVVPLFQEQIERGGPVTVTDAEATRFFMTIPEAAQLVLQASSLAQGGDLFLLDMGEPVKIVDLARKMIRLHGYRVRDDADPDGDIEIEITGLKPGEKLHEELLIADAASSTRHPKILRAEETYVRWPELRAALNTLEQACETFDYAAIKAFIESLVEGADLSEQLADLTQLSVFCAGLSVETRN